MINPKITIVTPSYNQNNFLEETIKSVINQSYNNIEFIIIDGGSTDGSVDTIKRFEKHLKFWISQKDNGQSDAIDRGFKMATGDILCWLNSDDVFIPGALENVARSFENNPHTDILLGDGMYSDIYGKITKYYRYVKPIGLLARHGLIAFGQQSMFFERNYYLKSGGILLDFHYCMDSEFVHRAIKSKSNFTIMRHGSGVFRWHDQMKSKLLGGRKAEESSIIAAKYYSSFPMIRLARFIYSLIQLFNGNYMMSHLKTKKLKNIDVNSLYKESK